MAEPAIASPVTTAAPSVPVFRLAEDFQNPVANPSMPLFHRVDITGDGTPDRVELDTAGGGIGFRVKVGTYVQKATGVITEGQKTLFSQLGATIGVAYLPTPVEIWKVPTEGNFQVINFDARDVTGDGDVDISFSVQATYENGTTEVKSYFLLNQTKPDEIKFAGEQPVTPSPDPKKTPLLEDWEEREVQQGLNLFPQAVPDVRLAAGASISHR